MSEQSPHIDVGVVVGLQHVASSITISTDPRQSRHRLQSQVPVRVLKVSLDHITELGRLQAHRLLQDRVLGPSADEER